MGIEWTRSPNTVTAGEDGHPKQNNSKIVEMWLFVGGSNLCVTGLVIKVTPNDELEFAIPQVGVFSEKVRVCRRP